MRDVSKVAKMIDSISVIKDKLTVRSIKSTSDRNGITESKNSYSVVRIQVETTPPYKEKAEEEPTGEQRSFWYEVKGTRSFVRCLSRLSRHLFTRCLRGGWPVITNMLER